MSKLNEVLRSLYTHIHTHVKLTRALSLGSDVFKLV